MRIGEVYSIFENIDSDKYTAEENAHGRIGLAPERAF